MDIEKKTFTFSYFTAQKENTQKTLFSSMIYLMQFTTNKWKEKKQQQLWKWIKIKKWNNIVWERILGTKLWKSTSQERGTKEF